MVVVDTVDDPVEARADALLGLEVEDQPVHPVLGQSPEHVAGEYEANDLKSGRLPTRPGNEESHDRGDEDQERNHRMHPGKPVQQLRIEHPR
jgi:hypothetical protein